MFVQCTALENITKRSERASMRQIKRDRFLQRETQNSLPSDCAGRTAAAHACHCGYFKFGICEWEMRPHEKPQQQQLELILARIANDSLLPLSPSLTALAGQKEREYID